MESFLGRFRDGCLNREQLHTLTEARVVIGDYRQDYNQLRPHSRLGYLSPAAVAKNHRPSPAPPSLHRGWIFHSEPTTINQRSGISHPLEQFRRLGQGVTENRTA